MKTKKCEWCGGSHRTTKCVQHCQHCQNTYEECECAWQIMQAGLPTARYPGEISIRYIKPHIEDRWSVAMEVGDNTTNEQIRDAIPALLAIRNCLVRFQGPMIDDELALMLHLEYFHEGGDQYTYNEEKESYAVLANSLNDRILGHLKAYLNDFLPDVFRKNDFSQAKSILMSVGKSEKEALRIIEELLQMLREGGGDHIVNPIDRDTIRNKLKNFKRTTKYKAWKAKNR